MRLRLTPKCHPIMRKLTSVAPKKKAQKMALADFFAETSTSESAKER